jgi:hypothetical protein
MKNNAVELSQFKIGDFPKEREEDEAIKKLRKEILENEKKKDKKKFTDISSGDMPDKNVNIYRFLKYI